MNHVSNALLAATAAALFMTASARAAGPDQSIPSLFNTLMTAAVANDYDGFTAVCDDAMKAAIDKSSVDGLNKQIAPRAKAGYDASYLGELNQHGFVVHLWRLRFESGGDDTLATLSVKDGKVGGFFLH